MTRPVSPVGVIESVSSKRAAASSEQSARSGWRTHALAPSEANLQIRLFGPFEVQVGGKPLPPLRTRKDAWLLALLVLRHGRLVDRVWLAGTLWPDSDHTESLRNLRNSLHELRRALGAQWERLESPTGSTLIRIGFGRRWSARRRLSAFSPIWITSTRSPGRLH